MPMQRLEAVLGRELTTLEGEGRRKGDETVIRGVRPSQGEHGPRYLLEGEAERAFLRMNSNGYLGFALQDEIIAAEESAVRRFGTGPQAVRFISGTFAPHVKLERDLAAFHGREACMIYSSAYAAVMGVLPSLISPETAVISDALNHNCIINAIRLSRPAQRHVFGHLDLDALEEALRQAADGCRRAIVVTDGVFSMRGDCAPLDAIAERVQRWDERFDEDCLLVVDDSHGVGALGATGRGTEEHTGTRADLLVATLGKAIGVNGGYVVGSGTTIEYLRETSPFYVYSNPITPAEAAAASAGLAILDGARGRALLDHLRAMTARFEEGVLALGFETIRSEHPVVPVLVRDTGRTRALVRHLYEHGVLATGLAYPVVPRGEEEVRFQVSAEHRAADIDEALDALSSFERGT